MKEKWKVSALEKEKGLLLTNVRTVLPFTMSPNNVSCKKQKKSDFEDYFFPWN